LTNLLIVYIHQYLIILGSSRFIPHLNTHVPVTTSTHSTLKWRARPDFGTLLKPWKLFEDQPSILSRFTRTGDQEMLNPCQ
jgi:hypothetical protein